jgi:hypothetical protein
LFVFVRLSETAPEVTNWLWRSSISSEVHEANPPGRAGRTDLDVIPHVRPTLGALPVTDVIQTLFPELKTVQVD